MLGVLGSGPKKTKQKETTAKAKQKYPQPSWPWAHLKRIQLEVGVERRKARNLRVRAGVHAER